MSAGTVRGKEKKDMTDEYISLTRDEAEYLLMLCRLAGHAASGTDLGRKQDAMSLRILQALQDPSCLSIPLTGEERNLLSLSVMVHALLTRGKYDAFREHFRVGEIGVLPEQVRAESIRIEGFALSHAIDPDGLNKKLRYREKKLPARKLYISDLHFYHDGLNRHMDMRGFSGYEEMNAYMIRQWNDHVTKKDEVYILGDFSISRGRAANTVLRQLHGKKYLVEGNHDTFLKDKEFDRSLFQWIRPYAEIHDAGRNVILSHYPVFCYRGQYRTAPGGGSLAYMLYGHVHDTHDERLVNEFIRITKNTMVTSKYRGEAHPIPCNMINCFCMFSDYVPLTLDDWIRLDRARREKMDRA